MSEGEARATLLAYQEARARIASKKLNRGFYQPHAAAAGGGKGKSRSTNEIQIAKSKSRCRKCGEIGHWARECPRKGASSSGGGVSSKDALKTQNAYTVEKTSCEMPSDGSFFVIADDAENRSEATALHLYSHERRLSQIDQVGAVQGQSLTTMLVPEDIKATPSEALEHPEEQECWNHDSFRHSTSCYDDISSDLTTGSHDCCMFSHPGTGVMFESHVSSANRLGLCLDTGCTRSLVGAETLKQLETLLRAKQIQILRKPKRCKFRFGADYQCTSEEVAVIPCSLGPYVICIAASVVPGSTPLLVSLPIMKALGMRMDFVSEKVDWTRLHVTTDMWFQAGHVYATAWDDLSAAHCQSARHILVSTSELRVYTVASSAQSCCPQTPDALRPLDVRETSSKESSQRRPHGDRLVFSASTDTSSDGCAVGLGGPAEGGESSNCNSHDQSSKDAQSRQSTSSSSSRCAEADLDLGHAGARSSKESGRSLESAGKSASGCTDCSRRVGSEGGSRCFPHSYLGQASRPSDERSAPGCQLLQVDDGQQEQTLSPRSGADIGSHRSDLCLASGGIDQEGDCGEVRRDLVRSSGQSSDFVFPTRIGGNGAETSPGDLDSSRNRPEAEATVKELPNGKRKRLLHHLEGIQALWSQSASEQPRLLLIRAVECATQFTPCGCLSSFRKKVPECMIDARWLRRLVSSHPCHVVCVLVPAKCPRACEILQVLEEARCGILLLEKSHRVLQVCVVGSDSKHVRKELQSNKVSGCHMIFHAVAQAILRPRIIQERGQRDNKDSNPPSCLLQMVAKCQTCSILARIGHDAQETLDLRIPMKAICQVIAEELPSTVPLNPHRTIVYSSTEGQIRGIHFGLQVRRGKGIASADYTYPRLLSLLHLLAKRRQVHHPYLAIQFNALSCGNGMPAHVDARNVGPSWVCSFGDYQGGMLQKKEGGLWVDVHHHHRCACLQQDQEHRVLPVTSGVRYSVVLCVPKGWDRALAQALLTQKLLAHGFIVPDTQSPVEYSKQQEPERMECLPAQETSEYYPFPAHSLTQLQTMLRQAHERMGHPHQAQYLRILTRAGATPLVIEQARLVRCSLCEEQKIPDPPRKSALMPSFGFNEVVGIDVFHLQGVKAGENAAVLNIVDWGTLYQVCVPLKQASSRKIRKAYRRNWLRNFGAPRKLICDQGTEFQGQDFATLLETDGTLLEVTPTDSPWQNARTERHGGTIKLMFSKARLGLKLDTKEEWDELLLQCCMAKNRYSLVGGYSPYQRVFGGQIRVPGGNLGDEAEPSDIAIMSALEAGDQTLLRSMQVRKEARDAFHYVDASSRVRRAILSGPRPLKNFSSGEVVYFWRREGDAQAFRHERAHSHWHGPAVVVAHMRSKIWISFRGHLWLCSPEQVRQASEEEKLAASPLIQDIVASARDLSSAGSVFQDLSEPSHELSGTNEPDTSAREAVVQDAVQRQEVSQDDAQMIPRTPPPQNLSLRGRSPGPRRERSSHGRSRTRDSLWNSQLDHDDQIVQSYLDDFGQVFLVDFSSGDVVEYLSLSAQQVGVRQKKELLYHRLDLANQQSFRKAMLHEWQTNILRPEAADLLSLAESLRIRQDESLRSRIVPTRWVLVEKDVGPGTDSVAKARLVLQGFKDPDLGELDVSSPTLSRDALPVLLQVIATMRWKLLLVDIKGAFMSSRPLERDQGPLFASLPRLWLFPEEADERQLAQVRCAWYGLNDGPREFYETLCEHLLSMGCRRSALDPCLFQWFKNGHLEGIVGATVDDLCCGGTQEFQRTVLGGLRNRFTIGKLEEGSGRFLGRDIHQQEDYSIWVDQVDYIEKIKTIDLSKERRREKGEPLTDEERSLLRAKAGELNWIQTVSRPDLAGCVSLLQMSFGQPTISSILEANRLI